MCAYPQYDHALPHWKIVLQCYAKCTCINPPDQETDNQFSCTTPSIRFHIYYIIACCTAHGRCVKGNICHRNLQKYTLENN